MSTITIYGASDDLIEIEGDLREEFTFQDEDNGDIVTFGDGTALRVTYTNDGFWRIAALFKGSAKVSKVEGTDPDDDYTDRVTLTGDLFWVSTGNHLYRIKEDAVR